MHSVTEILALCNNRTSVECNEAVPEIKSCVKTTCNEQIMNRVMILINTTFSIIQFVFRSAFIQPAQYISQI